MTDFFILTLLFLLLVFDDFTGSVILKTLAGYEGIFCRLSIFYNCIAQVLNEIYGKTVLYLG
ncbi:MAG: acetate uptake transporter [Flavobacteriales bacterium]